ncbi:MAG: DUF3365 domain-containing protein [Desulfobacteraceae bacterium]|nr:DUF3365 domain-containing protein [Desulfobacteraceae bacterium]
MRQTSLKYRNSKNKPDDYETIILKKFNSGEIELKQCVLWLQNSSVRILFLFCFHFPGIQYPIPRVPNF